MYKKLVGLRRLGALEIMGKKKLRCIFCKSTDPNKIGTIGISFGMIGNDYSFCDDCLDGMTAFNFLADIQEEFERRMKKRGRS